MIDDTDRYLKIQIAILDAAMTISAICREQIAADPSDKGALENLAKQSRIIAKTASVIKGYYHDE